MSEQPGNAVANYPKGKPWEETPIVENPLFRGSGVQEDVIEGDARKGGAPEWESHPAKENQFTTDTLHPKKSQ